VLQIQQFCEDNQNKGLQFEPPSGGCGQPAQIIDPENRILSTTTCYWSNCKANEYCDILQKKCLSSPTKP